MLPRVAVQAPQTLGGRSGEGGPGEGLFGPSHPSLSKDQADFFRHYWYPLHDGSISRPGKLPLFARSVCPNIVSS